jgi:hypothetical protein
MRTGFLDYKPRMKADASCLGHRCSLGTSTKGRPKEKARRLRRPITPANPLTFFRQSTHNSAFTFDLPRAAAWSFDGVESHSFGGDTAIGESWDTTFL